MGLPIKALPPFQNVVANQTATLPNLPMGMTYEAIHLQLGGTFTKAQCSAIRLRLGGKKIWEVAGSDLDKINQYNKLTASSTLLSLFFANPRAASFDEYLAGAIDTSAGYSDFAMEIDIGGATNPTITPYAELSAPLPKDASHKGMFRTLIKSVHSPASAAEFSLPVPYGSRSGALIRQVHFFHANITQLQFVKDSFYLVEKGTNAVLQYIENENSRTTQSGLISLDFVLNDFERTAVPTLRADNTPANFETKVTVSGADTVTAYSDMYQTHAGV